jgi:hypothetical protein
MSPRPSGVPGDTCTFSPTIRSVPGTASRFSHPLPRVQRHDQIDVRKGNLCVAWLKKGQSRIRSVQRADAVIRPVSGDSNSPAGVQPRVHLHAPAPLRAPGNRGHSSACSSPTRSSY